MSQKLVHNYAYSPDIDTFRVFLLGRDFWRHVQQSTSLLLIISPEHELPFPKPKINDLYTGVVILIIKKNIG